VQNTVGPILTICASYDVFLRKELHFGGHVTIFSGINYGRPM